ncbi:UDP-N-acetylmuramoyl-tripeptide--D-alanyl-D-alanine ligase [Leuconostocaceae bacterium ESL0723]|nr:UDP-N-acetylmuramoyl-tripeptide--D-alanyl-D-alanine ligase [Leuconostocaceae bacterium ESL0723]
MKLTLGAIRQALGAELVGDADQVVTGVHFDSRQIKPGDLFVALHGEHDGHDYLDAAAQAGAVAVLVEPGHQLNSAQNALVVSDTLQALQDLGRYWLDQVGPKVVAITGSNGKTTTKDMTAAVLASQYRTFKTPNNFNNEIGVPMTLLAMPADCQMLVVELGMDRPGQLTVLSKLVQPDVAVITMIGEAHIEFFKTRAKIAQAKLEITAGLKPGGVLLVPGDEPLLDPEKIQVPTQTFGKGAADLSSQQRETYFKYQGYTFAIPLLGRYNVMNALAAISVGQRLGVAMTQMVPALAHFDLTQNRTQWLTTPDGVVLLSDVYNANPTADREVLAVLGQQEAPRKFAVLGDMLELGDQALALHADLASAVLQADLDGVYLLGPLMAAALAPVLTERLGVGAVHAYPSNNQDQLVTDLKAVLRPEDLVLLKASHGIHLERVVTALLAVD